MSVQGKHVRSTGAVVMNTEPVSTTAALGRSESTGAAEFDAEPVTTTVDWLEQAGPETKVIATPERSAPQPAAAQPVIKDFLSP